MNAISKKAAPAARKASISTVKSPSVRQETTNTIPYVLIRKPINGTKITRQIINVIEVGNTQDQSYVRPARVAVSSGLVFGTNYPTMVSTIKDARVFAYSRRATHNKSSRTIMPWDIGNQAVVEALQKLGLITGYELEFHNAEANKMETSHFADEKRKAAVLKQNETLKQLADLAKYAIAECGVTQTQSALRKVKSLNIGA